MADKFNKLLKRKMAKDSKRITQAYWNNLPEDSRYRALRKVFSNFPDSSNKEYAMQKAKELGWMWEILVRHVKQPVGESYYMTIIDKTWIP
jgi:hypothetical protein